jgi:hypothetical protein
MDDGKREKNFNSILAAIYSVRTSAGVIYFRNHPAGMRGDVTK